MRCVSDNDRAAVRRRKHRDDMSRQRDLRQSYMNTKQGAYDQGCKDGPPVEYPQHNFRIKLLVQYGIGNCYADVKLTRAFFTKS